MAAACARLYRTESDGVFYLHRNDSYTFVRENGAITRIEVKLPGRTMTAQRLQSQ